MPELIPSPRKVLMLAAISIAAAAFVHPAWAHQSRTTQPSFDCGQAQTASERAICRDQDLRETDARTASIYQAAIGRAARVSDEAAVALIRQTQREFIAQRDACGWDRGCIDGEYRAITRQLQDFMHQLD